jgi:excisionase family DNA binding protein
MVLSRPRPAGKLSTRPLRSSRLAHNRGMNETDSGAGLGRFLTLADTAEILNVSAGQAYALVRSGELPAIKVGGSGHWRVERSVLESYIEAKYEESRRLSLWNQSEYADLPELFGGTRPPRNS